MFHFSILINRQFHHTFQNSPFKKLFHGVGDIVRNHDISYHIMRVVYNDLETNEKKWQILPRSDAIKLAKSMKADLILVNEKVDPVVCKIEDFNEIVTELTIKDKKEKEIKKSTKAMKEIHLAVNIAKHDFQSKLNKMIEFLEDGHSIKVVVMIKKQRTSNFGPEAIDETILKILEQLEHLANTVQQLDGQSPNRRDIIITPKPSPKKDTSIKP